MLDRIQTRKKTNTLGILTLETYPRYAILAPHSEDCVVVAAAQPGGSRCPLGRTTLDVLKDK